MTGIEIDRRPRRQLWRLRSLVEQLTEVDPAASLPFIVSAMAEAVGVDQLCVHLLDRPADESPPRLRCSAAVGLAPGLLDVLASLPDRGGRRTSRHRSRDRRGGARRRLPAGPALGTLPTPRVGRTSCAARGPCRSWARRACSARSRVTRTSSDGRRPISSSSSRSTRAMPRPRSTGSTCSPKRPRRNRVLETFRGVLDTMAGPQPIPGRARRRPLALCRGLGADAIALHETDGTSPRTPRPTSAPRRVTRNASTAAAPQQSATERSTRPRPYSSGPTCSPRRSRPRTAASSSRRGGPTAPDLNDALDLLDDAARSLRLAFEREALEEANAEAASLRRSHRLQQEFLSRLNHELRTPLTAIQGYASTLRQTDVHWDTPSQQRFLDSIASESARMGRLVGDLLDFGAIDSGVLRLAPDWCDLELVLEAARRCVPGAGITDSTGPGTRRSRRSGVITTGSSRSS